MVTLTEFVAARLDEDEAAAFNAARTDGTDWRPRSGIGIGHTVYAPLREPGQRGVADVATEEAAAHIARHDPARVLREVEAKRAILAEHTPETPDYGPFKGEPQCGSCGAVSSDAYYGIDWPCGTLRHLAAVYSDHPDYDPAWAVTR